MERVALLLELFDELTELVGEAVHGALEAGQQVERQTMGKPTLEIAVSRFCSMFITLLVGIRSGELFDVDLADVRALVGDGEAPPIRKNFFATASSAQAWTVVAERSSFGSASVIVFVLALSSRNSISSVRFMMVAPFMCQWGRGGSGRGDERRVFGALDIADLVHLQGGEALADGEEVIVRDIRVDGAERARRVLDGTGLCRAILHLDLEGRRDVRALRSMMILLSVLKVLKTAVNTIEVASEAAARPSRLPAGLGVIPCLDFIVRD